MEEVCVFIELTFQWEEADNKQMHTKKVMD